MSLSCQQSDVYRAEERALRRLGLQKLTKQEAQALVDGWRELPWWTQNFARVVHASVVVKSPDTTSSVGGLITAHGEFATVDRIETPVVAAVEMAPIHMNALYLAHEVSHPLSEARYRSHAHDPWFARTYLQLVYAALGSEIYRVLYEEFEREGVDHRIDE